MRESIRHRWIVEFRIFLKMGIGDHYIIKGREIEKVDLMTWAEWFEENLDARRVALDSREGVEVSTVFLGLDYNFAGIGPPILFETMIFGGEFDLQIMGRYATYDEALVGHVEACRRVDIADVLASEFITI
jgi:hypothetical protein